MHTFALGLGEAGSETRLRLSLRESQGRYIGGECLLGLCWWATRNVAACTGGVSRER